MKKQVRWKPMGHCAEVKVIKTVPIASFSFFKNDNLGATGKATEAIIEPYFSVT